MFILLGLSTLTVAVVFIILKTRRNRRRIELEQYSISPQDLYGLMHSDRRVLLFDVRQPLDLLANSTTIPGSLRVSPDELKRNPALIPRDEDVVVYCTCISDATAHHVIRRALSMHYTRARLLRGGLEAWRESGYPVEAYTMPFHLAPAVA